MQKKRKLDASALPDLLPQQGLTSVPLNTSAPEGFYQIVGFRPCGSRAVRVDMLERLADMIRTRVFWKQSREGEERPEGSIDGGGFTIVPDMMSLVGCSGEEFSSILKSRGFSAQTRPAPAKPAPPACRTPIRKTTLMLPDTRKCTSRQRH